MKKILSTSEILGFVSEGENELELCVTAEANFDEEKEQMEVSLDSCVRPLIKPRMRPICPPWLPKRQNLSERVPRSEATDLAREIFNRWAGRVRRSVPMPMHN